MKKLFGNIDKQWKVYALAACVTVLFYAIITHIGLCVSYVKAFFGFFGPVILGLVIAYILNPLAKWINDHVFVFIKKEKIRWTVSSFVSLILVLALLVLLVLSLIPQFVMSFKTFLDNLNGYIANLEKLLDTLSVRFGMESSEVMEQIEDYIVGENGMLSRAGTYLSRNISKIVRTASSAGSGFANFAIGIIVAVYFLIAKDSMLDAVRRLMKLLVVSEDRYTRFSSVLTRFNEIFTQYIAVELMDAILVGLVNYIFMTIAGMPNTLIVSCVVGVTNLAPTFGPIVGAAVGALILLLVKPSAVIAFLIFTVILQTVDGYVLKPKFFGSALSVPSALILIAIIAFGKMFGITGMLLAIPVAAIFVYLYKELLIPALEARKAAMQKRSAGN
ncbi:MAG: AI-2E family transporter [Firmicutes bacterium]|nr:AI-2E family transporter [Bacillota bacterium]MBR6350816.1 AI-2E family transporter [Bacillota bacterium]